MFNTSTQESVLYVVRHGETDWNALGKIQGWTDIPLNSKGEDQAQQLRSQLNKIPFGAAYTSDLSRAKRTAEIICQDQNLSIRLTQDLREGYKGRMEGCVMDANHWEELDTLRHSLPQQEFLNYKSHPEIESSAEIFIRIRSFVLECATQHLGHSVLIVSHAGVLRAILEHIKEPLPKNLRWKIDNCAWIQLIHSDNTLRIGNLHEIHQVPVKKV
jgi:broad specificity phosphatase PhoE